MAPRWERWDVLSQLPPAPAPHRAHRSEQLVTSDHRPPASTGPQEAVLFAPLARGLSSQPQLRPQFSGLHTQQSALPVVLCQRCSWRSIFSGKFENLHVEEEEKAGLQVSRTGRQLALHS